MYTANFTRQYQDNKKQWFEVWPVKALDDENVFVLPCMEKISRQRIEVLGDTVIDLTGFIVMPHHSRQLQYITKEEAENYKKVVR